MPIHDPDDEDWCDDEAPDEDEEDSAACPECGEPVPEISDRCPACGYWLSDADRRGMWSGESKPLWIRITVVVLLAAFLATLLMVW